MIPKTFSALPLVAIMVGTLAGALLGCQSTPETIPDDLAPREFFQLAQEAVVERSDHKTALFYYEKFLERYPDDVQRSVEAEYEIAFIYYKLNDIERSQQLLENLLEKYESPGAEVLPQWPRTLADKILTKITTEEE
ncbi:MAG: hypothetical protein CMN78_00500 [Spirochaetales bacterium]|nr:hypothetical protein [Spirochaetales bacterium]